MLRDAAPVVRLEKYGVYAMARYAEVHAALVDWQSFQSAAGVGLSNFRTEKPWRPPSVLLEADPPRHDAPRAVVAPLLTTRRLRELEERWRADAADPGRRAARARRRVRRRHRPRRGLSAPGLPRRGRASAKRAARTCCRTATSPSTRSVPRTSWSRAPRRTCRRSPSGSADSALRENLTDDGFGAQIWAAADRGEITPEQAPMIVRSLLTAGVDTTVTGIAAIMHALAHTPGASARLRATGISRAPRSKRPCG